MAVFFEDREKTYAHLCKDKLYPCARCTRNYTQQEKRDCGDKNCEKWMAWFKRTWRDIRKAYFEYKSGGQA